VYRTCHPHPTLLEAIKEAAMAAGDGGKEGGVGKPIHF
jgi:hypothetical protein